MSLLGLFLSVGTIACVVSAVRGGKSHKVVAGVAPFLLMVLAVLAALALIFRSERRLAYGQRPSLSAMLDRGLEVLPFLHRLYRSWHGPGYTKTAVGRVLAVGVNQAGARQNAKVEELWQRHRERWHDDLDYRFIYREQRRQER